VRNHGRFTFGEVQALVCRGVDVDGEYFLHKVKDANNRPGFSFSNPPDRFADPNAPDAPDGIGVDAVGSPVFYRVSRTTARPSMSRQPDASCL